MHKPIQFKNLDLSFPHKTCFTGFNAQIMYGSRIGIVGANGSGKSTLLKMIQEQVETSSGDIYLPKDLRVGYLPQSIESFQNLSGGERLNRVLTHVLASDPNILLLDEPTNHLDSNNRHSLLRLLRTFSGTLLIATHDIEVINSLIDTIWHIESSKIHVFCGNYEDYQQEKTIRRNSIEEAVTSLKSQKIKLHQSLMKEQARAKNSRIRGEKHIHQRKWPTVRSASKLSNAVDTSDLKRSALKNKKMEFINQLNELRIPEKITPKFVVNANRTHHNIIAICHGEVGYSAKQSVLKGINLNIGGTERVALLGDNGSGKSTLIKAILGNNALVQQGTWLIPPMHDISYLDQHYATFQDNKTVLDVITEALPHTTYLEIRKHLNNFLFRKNEEVLACVSCLSGGEKARLSLAQIAAKTPKLLILDEMTNNLDFETRTHVIDMLNAYQGALIVVSHDVNFFKAINISTYYQICEGLLEEMHTKL